uniref:Coiled-coil domain containing 28B n=1 Tax=Equus asinus asinus TaxID=83772 RepID=A0A8C4LQZ8_EQUAS
MEDKKKKRSPKPCLTQPAQAPGSLRRVPVPTSHSGSLALGLPHLPSPKQRAKFKRVGKEKCRPVLAGGGGGSAGTPLQHSFLTEVTDVYEMEGGLLNLLNDFHSGRLQDGGGACAPGSWRPDGAGAVGSEGVGDAGASRTGVRKDPRRGIWDWDL